MWIEEHSMESPVRIVAMHLQAEVWVNSYPIDGGGTTHFLTRPSSASQLDELLQLLRTFRRVPTNFQ